MGAVAIIGAGGFVGAALLDVLTAAGETCIAVGRDDSLPDERLDAVIDCNGEGRRFWCNENPDESFVRNVNTVADRLSGLDFETYVYVSTVDVYGEGRSAQTTSREDCGIDESALDIYGLHKYLAEKLVLEKARHAIVLRCATVIGPGLRKNPVYDLLNNQPLRMTAESTLSLVHTETLGHAVQALRRNACEGVYNLAASAPMRVPELCATLAGARGTDVESMPMHSEQITTAYDVNIEKISAVQAMPTSLQALEKFLDRDVAA